jgi:hypothetical protein
MHLGKYVNKFTTNALIDRYSNNPKLLYDAESVSGNVHPMRLVKKMFENGYWLNTYELPFFGNTYLQSNNETKWTVGGLETLVKSKKAQDIIKETLSVDFPTQPTFQVGNMGTTGYETIQVEFYLINRDTSWLKKNFQFLHAFYAGTQWVHMTGRNN